MVLKSLFYIIFLFFLASCNIHSPYKYSGDFRKLEITALCDGKLLSNTSLFIESLNSSGNNNTHTSCFTDENGNCFISLPENSQVIQIDYSCNDIYFSDMYPVSDITHIIVSELQSMMNGLESYASGNFHIQSYKPTYRYLSKTFKAYLHFDPILPEKTFDTFYQQRATEKCLSCTGNKYILSDFLHYSSWSKALHQIISEHHSSHLLFINHMADYGYPSLAGKESLYSILFSNYYSSLLLDLKERPPEHHNNLIQQLSNKINEIRNADLFNFQNPFNGPEISPVIKANTTIEGLRNDILFGKLTIQDLSLKTGIRKIINIRINSALFNLNPVPISFTKAEHFILFELGPLVKANPDTYRSLYLNVQIIYNDGRQLFEVIRIDPELIPDKLFSN